MLGPILYIVKVAIIAIPLVYGIYLLRTDWEDIHWFPRSWLPRQQSQHPVRYLRYLGVFNLFLAFYFALLIFTIFL